MNNTRKTYTLKQCKADMLTLWGILKDNPHITSKITAIEMMDDPCEVKRFKALDCKCPCCEYASSRLWKMFFSGSLCNYCPCWDASQEEYCSFYNKPNVSNEFDFWDQAYTDEERKYWATLIYNRGLAIDDSVEED